MNKSARPHLAYIIDTLEIIKLNTPSSQSEFMSDANARDATLMRLQDIGEHLARIRDSSPEYFAENQEDSWHRLIGLRNIIAHGYREVDFEIIWDVLETKLQDFRETITRLSKS